MPPSMQEQPPLDEQDNMLLGPQPWSSSTLPTNNHNYNFSSSTERPLGSSTPSTERPLGSTQRPPVHSMTAAGTAPAATAPTTTTSRPVSSSPPVQRKRVGVFDVEVVTEETLQRWRNAKRARTQREEGTKEDIDSSSSLSSSPENVSISSSSDDEDEDRKPFQAQGPPHKKQRLKGPPLVGTKYQVDALPDAVLDKSLYQPSHPCRGGTCVWNPARVTAAAWMWLDDRNIRNRGNVLAPLHLQVQRMRALAAHDYKWMSAQMAIEARTRDQDERRAHYEAHSRVLHVTTAEPPSRRDRTSNNNNRRRPDNRHQRKKKVQDASSTLPLWDSSDWNSLTMLRPPPAFAKPQGVISWEMATDRPKMIRVNVPTNSRSRKRMYYNTDSDSSSDDEDSSSSSSDEDCVEVLPPQQRSAADDNDDVVLLDPPPPPTAGAEDDDSSSCSDVVILENLKEDPDMGNSIVQHMPDCTVGIYKKGYHNGRFIFMG
eukprot:scaffold19_cov169-Amphora_coffeaeformis.AAC.5